jgi:hypothetical protein
MNGSGSLFVPILVFLLVVGILSFIGPRPTYWVGGLCIGAAIILVVVFVRYLTREEK